MQNKWKFSDSENTAVFSIRKIMNGDESILHVFHDEEDGAWQFLGLETPNQEDAVIVHLKHFVETDPSTEELHDLPRGWHAWRKNKNEKWTREKRPPDMESVQKLPPFI
jgi:hypothetical protein